MSTSTPRSRTALGAAAGATAAVLLLGACGANTTPPGAAFTGSWTIETAPAPGVPPGPKLLTFFADGNVLVAEPGSLTSQNGAGVEFVGPGQGTYTVSGDTAHFVAHVLVSDIKGAPTGHAVVSGDVRPGADGTLAGPITIDRVHLDGSSAAETARTTGTATRITR